MCLYSSMWPPLQMPHFCWTLLTSVSLFSLHLSSSFPRVYNLTPLPSILHYFTFFSQKWHSPLRPRAPTPRWPSVWRPLIGCTTWWLRRLRPCVSGWMLWLRALKDTCISWCNWSRDFSGKHCATWGGLQCSAQVSVTENTQRMELRWIFIRST